MPRLIADRIREALMAHSDGLTIDQLLTHTQSPHESNMRKAVERCWGVYIDRWQGPIRGQWQAVYCLAEVPKDAPKPSKHGLRVKE